MSLRRTLSLAAVTALLAIGSAQAGVYEQPKSQPKYPGVTNNSITANNVAAGWGNTANQNIFASQQGGYGQWPGFTGNTLTGNNVAAGTGNKANQDIMSDQRGGKIPTFNSVDALNLAAGTHNRANQRLMTQQR